MDNLAWDIYHITIVYALKHKNKLTGVMQLLSKLSFFSVSGGRRAPNIKIGILF